MILDSLDNWELYAEANTPMEAAFGFLRQHALTAFPDGRYDLDGNNLYAIVSHYDTQSEDSMTFERHNKYADIQFIRSGEELIYWFHRGDIHDKTAYDESDDVSFYSAHPAIALPLDAGKFTVLFPDDIHKPRCATKKGTCVVEKVVIKLKLDYSSK